MTNREMLNKYKELIENELEYDTNDAEEILTIGRSLERYMWMDAELKDDDKDKKKGDE